MQYLASTCSSAWCYCRSNTGNSVVTDSAIWTHFLRITGFGFKKELRQPPRAQLDIREDQTLIRKENRSPFLPIDASFGNEFSIGGLEHQVALIDPMIQKCYLYFQLVWDPAKTLNEKRKFNTYESLYFEIETKHKTQNNSPSNFWLTKKNIVKEKVLSQHDDRNDRTLPTRDFLIL